MDANASWLWAFDPFAGTSTFTVRLLQSGLIKPEDLARKYANELFATEIMLLAYYVSAVNIETTYNALREEAALRNGEAAPEYVPFTNIALADTFQIHEEGDIPDLNIFRENNETIERQKNAPINVVIGNPPYSVGQKSANDLNANRKYPSLDARISETYAARSTATNKNSLYDSYLRAFRWATDRIGGQGVVVFVTNNGWVDGNTSDGIRLSMAEDFTDLYILNLRGNSLPGGELAKQEGGNVFDIRVGVSIAIGVKDTSQESFELHYVASPDYASKAEKIEQVVNATVGNLNWQSIAPNQDGDWLNQRSEDFVTWPVIGEKRDKSTTFFEQFSAGLKTGRDSWAYAQTENSLLSNLGVLVDTYAEATAELHNWLNEQGILKPRERDVTAFLLAHSHFADTTKISWNRTLKNLAAKDTEISVCRNRVYRSLYRPFMKQRVYFERALNDMTYQLPSMFPTSGQNNVGFYCLGVGATADFALLSTRELPDVGLTPGK